MIFIVWQSLWSIIFIILISDRHEDLSDLALTTSLVVCTIAHFERKGFEMVILLPPASQYSRTIFFLFTLMAMLLFAWAP